MYRLQVNGRFAAQIAPGSIHCGPDPKRVLAYQFHVAIEADRLDADGFVMDNMDCVRYFDQQQMVRESCELLAHRACAELWRDNFTSITVTIHGTDFANVSCTKSRRKAARKSAGKGSRTRKPKAEDKAAASGDRTDYRSGRAIRKVNGKTVSIDGKSLRRPGGQRAGYDYP